MSYFFKIKDILNEMLGDESSKEDPINRMTVVNGEHLTINMGILNAKGNVLHTQLDHDECVLILGGSVKFRVGDEYQQVSEGDFVFIPQNTLHGPTFANKEEEASFTALSIFGPKFEQTKENVTWDRDE